MTAERTSDITNAQRTAARWAALAFPVSILCVGFANFGLRAAILDSGDWARNAQTIAMAESTFRLAVIFDISYCLGIIASLAAHYVILSAINRLLAVLAGLTKLLFGMTTVAMALTNMVSVHLASDPHYRRALGAEPLHELLKLSSAAAWDQYYVGLAFWALSSALFAWLWLQSRYIPAALAGAGILASVWALFCAVAFLLHPAFGNTVNVWAFDMPLVLFHLSLSGWLLFKGLRGTGAPVDVGRRP